jgi:hypothetical protein
MTNHGIDKFGNQYWYNENNNLHRINGPSIIWVGGTQTWWINGVVYYTNSSFQRAAGITDEDMLAMILTYGNVE